MPWRSIRDALACPSWLDGERTGGFSADCLDFHYRDYGMQPELLEPPEVQLRSPSDRRPTYPPPLFDAHVVEQRPAVVARWHFLAPIGRLASDLEQDVRAPEFPASLGRPEDRC